MSVPLDIRVCDDEVIRKCYIVLRLVLQKGGVPQRDIALYIAAFAWSTLPSISVHGLWVMQLPSCFKGEEEGECVLCDMGYGKSSPYNDDTHNTCVVCV